MRNSIERGFTLIELLVVISIIGLLSSIVLTSVSVARSKGRNASVLLQVHQIDIALSLAQSDSPTGTLPDPGGYAGQWYCLKPSGMTCWTYISGSDIIMNALRPYMPNVPTPPTVDISGNYNDSYLIAVNSPYLNPPGTYLLYGLEGQSSGSCQGTYYGSFYYGSNLYYCAHLISASGGSPSGISY